MTITSSRGVIFGLRCQEAVRSPVGGGDGAVAARQDMGSKGGGFVLPNAVSTFLEASYLIYEREKHRSADHIHR